MIYIIPTFILIILLIGYIKGVSCFDSFVDGARQGAITIIKLTPSLIGLIVSIGIFKASGVLEVIVDFITPMFETIGLSGDVFPLILIRPISGSAALATLKEIISDTGVDSVAAKAACIMMGSTETIFYTLTVYTSKTNIKKLPGVLPAALIGNFISAIMAGIIVAL